MLPSRRVKIFCERAHGGFLLSYRVGNPHGVRMCEGQFMIEYFEHHAKLKEFDVVALRNFTSFGCLDMNNDHDEQLPTTHFHFDVYIKINFDVYSVS